MSNQVNQVTCTEIRGIESEVLKDAANVNKLLLIKKKLIDDSESGVVRRAALHAMRRIFVKWLDENQMVITSNTDIQKNDKKRSKTKTSDTIKSTSNQSSEMVEYIKWKQKQYHLVL